MAVADISLLLNHHIGGEVKGSTGTQTWTLRSAVDDHVVTDKLLVGTAEDVDIAVKAAEAALPVWRSMSADAKRTHLHKFADLIEASAERLSQLEVIVTGKASSFTKQFEVGTLSRALRYYAGFVDKLDGNLKIGEDGITRGVIYEPYGVCAAIIPFNSPIVVFGNKIPVALATGNTLIIKTSEYNPLSTMYLAELATQAGFPPGTLNFLHGGPEVGQALSSHMKIRKISFTGSAIVGRKIQIAAAQSNLKRVTLELGGKSPVLVFADADIPNAIQNICRFVTLNGQGCVLGTRVYVEEGIAGVVISNLKQAMEQFAQTLGSDPTDPKTTSSPIFHHAQRDRVLEFIEAGKKEADLLTGGGPWGKSGCFIEPTIFTNPKKGARILTEEIFGPVLVICTFRTETEAIAMANDTEYGLGAYAYTSNIDRIMRLSKAFEAGTVCINVANPMDITVPFGGWKGSGLGYENGKEAISCWMQAKTITINFNPNSP